MPGFEKTCFLEEEDVKKKKTDAIQKKRGGR